MNPFERLDIYSDARKAEYAQLDPRSAPPHIFAVGEAAYRAISRKGKFKNQAIIVSGESGSGKTVGNKLLMDYFAFRSGGASASYRTGCNTGLSPMLGAVGRSGGNINVTIAQRGAYEGAQISHYHYGAEAVGVASGGAHGRQQLGVGGQQQQLSLPQHGQQQQMPMQHGHQQQMPLQQHGHPAPFY